MPPPSALRGPTGETRSRNSLLTWSPALAPQAAHSAPSLSWEEE